MGKAQRERTSATVSFKRLRRLEGKGFPQLQGRKPTTYGIDGNNKHVRNVKAMIGRGSNFPSATAEKEMIKSSNVKLKNSRGKNNQIGKEVEVNTDYPSATAGGKANIFRFSHDENAIKRKMMKFDQSLKFFKHYKN